MDKEKVTVTEGKKAFKSKIPIFGEIPSVVLLGQSTSDREFEAFLKKLFEEKTTPGDRFIPGVGDAAPPDANFERLLRITEIVQQWGRLPMSP